MKTIAAKLLKEFNSKRSTNVLNFKEALSLKKELDAINADLSDRLAKNDRDPSHKIYTLLQNLLSYFAEEISIRDEFEVFYDRINEDMSLLMPSYPPMSPLTLSYYNWWIFFDFQFGRHKETMGGIYKQLIESDDPLGLAIRGLDELLNSYMKFYSHEGRKDGLVKLKDITTGEISLCLCTSGYFGSKGDIWLARIVPNLDEIYDYHIVITTPYVIKNYKAKDWIAFLKRQKIIDGNQVNLFAYKKFMKWHSDDDYWHNYILDAYVNYTSNCIFLTGIPDLKGTKPHEMD